MSIQIYRNNNFKIYKVGKEFIIHNTNKKFEEGHTHVHKYNVCLTMINLIMHKKIPKNHDKYFIESIIRLSDDKKYINKLKKIIKRG